MSTLVFILVIHSVCRTINTHPDAGLNVIQMIKNYGYPLEIHKDLKTEDGYLLEIHRIPNSKPMNRSIPVLLMHCLGGSSVEWVNGGPINSLAYNLADLDYDVWLGNSRGNKWGRKHISIDPDTNSKEFWNYSFHEIGLYDLPTIIDYILLNTGANKLFYVGHSQGTTAFFVMGSLKPEYNDKIILMSALAPVVFTEHMSSPLIKYLATIKDKLESFANILDIYELSTNNKLYQTFMKSFGTHPQLQKMCINSLIIWSVNSAQMNYSLIPVIATNMPSGVSIKQYMHYGQGTLTGDFTAYDYKLENNMKLYGTPNPPKYNLSKISAPIALYYGQNDWISSVIDVQRLRDLLPNVVNDYKIPNEKFNHFDFLWAYNVSDVLYKNVIKEIQNYSKFL